MDEQEAKFLLQAGHSRPGDTQAPHFKEAEALAARQAELGAWVDRQQAITDALQRKLRETPVPADLRARILAGSAVTQPLPRKNRRQWLALAAGIVVMMGVRIWQLRPMREGTGNDFAGLRHDLATFLGGYFSLEFHSPQLAAVKQHLADRHQFTAYEIPAALTGQPSVGCRRIDWHGQQVVLICFNIDHQLVHLFIVPRGALTPETPSNHQFGDHQEDGFATTGWSDEQNVYLVATPGTAAFLKHVLAGKAG